MGWVPGGIVDEECSDGTAIVRAGDGTEVFLSCCVPNLQFDNQFIDCCYFGAELYSDGGIMVGFELTVDELQHDAGLADGCVGPLVHESPITMYLNR